MLQCVEISDRRYRVESPLEDVSVRLIESRTTFSLFWSLIGGSSVAFADSGYEALSIDRLCLEVGANR
jgi:hypothetical protein